jgi:hypothetical protein
MWTNFSLAMLKSILACAEENSCGNENQGVTPSPSFRQTRQREGNAPLDGYTKIVIQCR